MKSGRIKVMLIIASILLIALILNAILTWGIVFDRDGGFEWSRTYIFEKYITDNQASQIVLGDNPNNPIFYIPFVVYIYNTEPPPYVINLDISDETQSYKKLFVKTISIEYVDGQSIEHKIEWEKQFESTSLLTSVDSKNIRIPVVQIIDKLPVTVDRRQSCNIRFVGYFVNNEGTKIPFDTTEFFEYEPYSWRVYPVRGSF